MYLKNSLAPTIEQQLFTLPTSAVQSTLKVIKVLRIILMKSRSSVYPEYDREDR
jgi:hypothetical protein